MITKCQSEQTAKVDEIDIPLSYLVFLKHESKPLSSAESEIGNDEHISLNVRVHSWQSRDLLVPKDNQYVDKKRNVQPQLTIPFSFADSIKNQKFEQVAFTSNNVINWISICILQVLHHKKYASSFQKLNQLVRQTAALM
jgi:hypothetical protein